EDNIHFKLFTRKQQSDSKTIVISKEYNNILQIGFDVTKSTKVIVHGFKSSSNFFALVRIKNNYLSKYDCNVIMVDWSHYAEGEYVSTIGRSRIIAVYVARLFLVLIKHGVQDIHAIGFSLGAHIPAVATTYLGNNKLKRITGLDPAKPFLMNVGLDAKLDSSDAEFVDVYHTESFIQGKAEACGHVDFKMNWGEIQPGCGDLNIGCAHERAPVYFAESIISENGFWGYPEYLHRQIIGGEVSRESVLKLADEYVDRNVRGWYEVPTNTNSPFAKGRNF
ncbi:GSCOCG00011484001-RA-CDS, partial [Cotesia congregata]